MGPSLTLLSTTIDTRSCALAALAGAASASTRANWRRLFGRSIIIRRVYGVRSGIASRWEAGARRQAPGARQNTARGIHERAMARRRARRQPSQGIVHADDRE